MTELKVMLGDITGLSVDAIVNAANTSLLGGGGVDGAIHKAAGPELLSACRVLGGCETGDAKITPAFNLPGKYVVHTVGPIWSGGSNNEASKLALCYQRSLQLAVDHQMQSIAFPAISCGVYGYPIEQATVIAVDTVHGYCKNEGLSIRSVLFVCFEQKIAELYQHLLTLKGIEGGGQR